MTSVSKINMDRQPVANRTIGTRLPTRTPATISKESVQSLRGSHSVPLQDSKKHIILAAPKRQILPSRSLGRLPRLSSQKKSADLSKDCRISRSWFNDSRPCSKDSAYSGSTSSFGDSNNLSRAKGVAPIRGSSPSSSSDGCSSTKGSPDRQFSNTVFPRAISPFRSRLSPPVESPTPIPDNFSDEMDQRINSSSSDFGNLTGFVHKLNESLSSHNGPQAGKVESEIQQLREMLKRCRHPENSIRECESHSSSLCKYGIQRKDADHEKLDNSGKTSSYATTDTIVRRNNKMTGYTCQHEIYDSGIASELIRLRLEVQRTMLDNQEKNVIITTLTSELAGLRENFDERSKYFYESECKFRREIEHLRSSSNCNHSAGTKHDYKDANIETDLSIGTLASRDFFEAFQILMGEKDEEIYQLRSQFQKIRDDNQAEVDETERVVREGMESRVVMLIKALDETLEKNLELESKLAIFEKVHGTVNTKLDEISESGEGCTSLEQHAVNKAATACQSLSSDEAGSPTTRNLIDKSSNQSWRWIREFRRRK